MKKKTGVKSSPPTTSMFAPAAMNASNSTIVVLPFMMMLMFCVWCVLLVKHIINCT